MVMHYKKILAFRLLNHSTFKYLFCFSAIYSFFSLTSTAEAVNLELVALDLKAVFSGNIRLKLFNPFVFKLNYLSAARTDKVVVMAIRGLVLIARKSVLNRRSSHACPASSFSVRYTVANPIPIGLFHAGIQLFRAQVAACLHEHLKDVVSLARRFEALALKVVR
jgi:hypothetical protein